MVTLFLGKPQQKIMQLYTTTLGEMSGIKAGIRGMTRPYKSGWPIASGLHTKAIVFPATESHPQNMA